MRLFVNGVLQRPTDKLTADYKAGSDSFTLGAHFPSSPVESGYAGIIDEVRISKVARYTTNFTPPTRFQPDKDTLALYHFDEGSGDVLTDSSGNNHHGRIVNAKWVPGIGGGPPLGATAGLASSAPPVAIAPFDATQAKAHQEAWAKHLGVPVEQSNSIGMKLHLIPPGEFLMGSTPDEIEVNVKSATQAKLRPSTLIQVRSEGPQHRVAITRPFLAGRTEVKIGNFRMFVGSTDYVTECEREGDGFRYEPNQKEKAGNAVIRWSAPGYAVSDDSPVTLVSWNDCVAFCNWLSEREDLIPSYRKDAKDGWVLVQGAPGYRLPTEAEWEYACRAGTSTQFSFGDDESLLERYGWYGKNARGAAQAVGLKPPNAFGLYDMHGNVNEWCHDSWGEKWYQNSPTNDPVRLDSGGFRVHRGGDLRKPAQYSRSAFRDADAPATYVTVYGFRVVRTSSAPFPIPKSNPTDFALEFNGKDSYVDLPTLKYDGSHPITIEAAIVPYQAEMRATVITDRGPYGFDMNFPSGFDKGGLGIFSVMDAKGYCNVYTRDPLMPGRRIHVVGILNNSDTRIFVDGKRQSAAKLDGGYKAGNTPFRIGAQRPSGPRQGFNPFAGLVDELRISRIARYTTDFTPPTRFQPDKDTLALYHFDEGQGDALTDSSGNNHHGKIMNAKWVPGIAGEPSVSGQSLRAN
jgi:formylglycine-generating enzyme required for sulfatase activity